MTIMTHLHTNMTHMPELMASAAASDALPIVFHHHSTDG